jgi:hypothetical protein
MSLMGKHFTALADKEAAAAKAKGVHYSTYERLRDKQRV